MREHFLAQRPNSFYSGRAPSQIVLDRALEKRPERIRPVDPNQQRSDFRDPVQSLLDSRTALEPLGLGLNIVRNRLVRDTPARALQPLGRCTVQRGNRCLEPAGSLIFSRSPLLSDSFGRERVIDSERMMLSMT